MCVSTRCALLCEMIPLATGTKVLKNYLGGETWCWQGVWIGLLGEGTHHAWTEASIPGKCGSTRVQLGGNLEAWCKKVSIGVVLVHIGGWLCVNAMGQEREVPPPQFPSP